VIDDFAAIEHAYAPPYAPALDPLAVLAMAAANQVDGIESVAPLTNLSRETVLDVRVETEREERPLTAGALHEIEVSELRGRVDEIPDGPLLVACAHGTRSAEVVRWLTHCGIQARYLGGGVSWRVRALSPESSPGPHRCKPQITHIDADKGTTSAFICGICGFSVSGAWFLVPFRCFLSVILESSGLLTKRRGPPPLHFRSRLGTAP
jgi:rhodanese-related sulfurtransferase